MDRTYCSGSKEEKERGLKKIYKSKITKHLSLPLAIHRLKLYF